MGQHMYHGTATTRKKVTKNLEELTQIMDLMAALVCLLPQQKGDIGHTLNLHSWQVYYHREVMEPPFTVSKHDLRKREEVKFSIKFPLRNGKQGNNMALFFRIFYQKNGSLPMRIRYLKQVMLPTTRILLQNSTLKWKIQTINAE